jgi:hypothetical protein
MEYGFIRTTAWDYSLHGDMPLGLCPEVPFETAWIAFQKRGRVFLHSILERPGRDRIGLVIF